MMETVNRCAAILLLFGLSACGGEILAGEPGEIGSLDALEMDISSLPIASSALLGQDLPQCAEAIEGNVELMQYPGSQGLVVVISGDGSACVAPAEVALYVGPKRFISSPASNPLNAPLASFHALPEGDDPVPIRPVAAANANPQGDDPVPIKPNNSAEATGLDPHGDDPVPIKPDPNESPVGDDPVPIKPEGDDDPVPISASPDEATSADNKRLTGKPTQKPFNPGTFIL